MNVFHAEKRPDTPLKPHQMRRQGVIPMALISRDHGASLLQANRQDVQGALRSLDGHGRIDLEIGEQKTKKRVIVKQVDNDPLHGGILNVVLQEVSNKDVVKIDVPVLSIDNSEDERGVMLTQPTTHLKLQGPMGNLPAHIEVDVTKLEAGSHINAGDIELPEDVKLISSPDATVFSRQVVKAVSLEPETAEESTADEASTDTEG